MNKINYAFLIALIPTAFFILWFLKGESILPFNPDVSGTRTIYIEQLPLSVEIADTSEERTRGLSGKVGLEPNEGLLFVFDNLGAHGIWMHQMKFPIDVVWIAPTSDTSSSGGGETLRIVDLEQYIQPDTFPHVFYPKRNALYVLEVSAGFTEIHGIEVGDQVRF
jgi:hypothetical protein